MVWLVSRGAKSPDSLSPTWKQNRKGPQRWFIIVRERMETGGGAGGGGGELTMLIPLGGKRRKEEKSRSYVTAHPDTVPICGNCPGGSLWDLGTFYHCGDSPSPVPPHFGSCVSCLFPFWFSLVFFPLCNRFPLWCGKNLNLAWTGKVHPVYIRKVLTDHRSHYLCQMMWTYCHSWVLMVPRKETIAVLCFLTNTSSK